MGYRRRRFRVEDIQRLVHDELARAAPVSNRSHGVSEERAIENLVVPPRSERFFAVEGPGFVWRWRVWDERPEDPIGGYLIVLEPREWLYQLASKPEGRRFGRLVRSGASTLGETIRSM